jgi:putative transposase
VIQLPSMSFRLIEAERARHPVSLPCAVLGVTRAGHYAWRERCPSPREREDEKLQALIRRIFSDSQESYGAPRVQAALADDYGLRVGKMRVLSASRPSTFTAELPFQPRELRSRRGLEFGGHAGA